MADELEVVIVLPSREPSLADAGGSADPTQYLRQCDAASTPAVSGSKGSASSGADDPHNLARFVRQAAQYHEVAHTELLTGHKSSCWSWYVLPTPPFIKNGHEVGSLINRQYALRSDAEGCAYVRHTLLRNNYIGLVTAIAAALQRGVTPACLLGIDVPRAVASAEYFCRLGAMVHDDELALVAADAVRLLKHGLKDDRHEVAKTVADETTVIGNVDHTSSQDLSTSDQDTGLVNQQRGGELKCWKPEDAAFWAGEGKAIAYRNLALSVPNLALAFAVWLMWSSIVVIMQESHDEEGVYSLSGGSSSEYKENLYLLPAVAGLAGAAFRLPNAFTVPISGGRNCVTVTTLLLIIPVVLGGVLLSDSGVSIASLCVAASLAGIGGGAFGSSMNNISFYFPSRLQGLALGLNGALGNLGVSVAQFLCPIAASLPLPRRDQVAAANAAWIWLPFLLLCGGLSWMLMNSLPGHTPGGTWSSCLRFLALEGTGLGAAAAGVAVITIAHGYGGMASSGGLVGTTIAATLLSIVVGHAAMRYCTPKAVRAKVTEQLVVFGDRNTFVTTFLYTMCFGSFIGFSSAFPKLIQDVFGYLPDGKTPDPAAPNPKRLAWLGPALSSGFRPLGGWLGDRYGGAQVTQAVYTVMLACACGAGAVLRVATAEPGKGGQFEGFFALMMALFALSGIANGSTFQQVGVLFVGTQRGAVLGWAGAIAAYGGCILPVVLGVAIHEKMADAAFFGLAGGYGVALILNFWYYIRAAPSRVPAAA